MDLEPEVASQTPPASPRFAESSTRPPLVLLRDTERSLRLRTLSTLVPILPSKTATNLREASTIAETSLNQLAAIDLDAISDAELRPARIQMGLIFVGFGSLTVLLLLLYLTTLHPQLATADQLRSYWHQYVWFVSLGVAGMFMLGREAMRPAAKPRKP